MIKRIPTYEDAKNIVNTKGELVFYETVREIDGFKVSTFNYRLPTYSDFFDNEIEVKEMRGLTFVFNEDGSLYKRYILLKKFWNINQVTETLYNNIKNYKLKFAYNKEDGSLITFIRLPNGKVIAKTKMGFDNEQVEEAEKIYNSNKNIRDFVNKMLDDDIISMWEFVSFKNKIVLNYKEPKLILLKLRDNISGNYLDVEKYRNKEFDVVKKEEITVDEALEKAKTLENKEGWVFTLIDENENDFLIKIKTNWYFDRHNLLTNELNREDYVIKAILTNTIDDIVSQLDNEDDKDKLEFIRNIEIIVQEFLEKRIKEVEDLLSKFKGDKKDFALRYKKDKNFSIVMTIINKNKEVFETVTEWLLEQTKKLEMARSFIKRKGFKRK